MDGISMAQLIADTPDRLLAIITDDDGDLERQTGGDDNDDACWTIGVDGPAKCIAVDRRPPQMGNLLPQTLSLSSATHGDVDPSKTVTTVHSITH
jgi:hypothetical protein